MTGVICPVYVFEPFCLGRHFVRPRMTSGNEAANDSKRVARQTMRHRAGDRSGLFGGMPRSIFCS